MSRLLSETENVRSSEAPCIPDADDEEDHVHDVLMPSAASRIAFSRQSQLAVDD